MIRFILSTFLLSTFVFVKAQQTVIIEPILDNTLFERSDGSLSNGSGQYLFLGNINPAKDPEYRRRLVIKFDIASNVPAGATITGASLTMNMNRTVSGALDVDLHTISLPWGEGVSNAGGVEGLGAQSEENDATWIHTFFSGSFWSNAGGDFNPSPSASNVVSGIGSYSWSSSQMAADVQNWLNTPANNNGWILIADETKNRFAKRFDSREATNPALRPKLNITYTLPCQDPDIPSLVVSANPSCPDSTVTISVNNGDLNDATAWHFYTGSCGGNLITSNASGELDLNVSSTATFFVRGEGGCVTPTACGQITVQVTAKDDASFSYTESQSCIANAVLNPSVSGAATDSFSVQPAGLSLDKQSGEINLSGSEPGIYTITRLTSGTCPNTANYTLEILDTSLVNLAVQICEGTSYSFDGQELTQSGQYTAVFSNQAGCDSTVNLNLTVVPEIVNDGNEFNICEGETVIVGGISYNEAGNYSQTFTSQAGCDSTYNFEVIVNEAFQENRSETICSGDSLLFFGEYLKSAGVYDTVFQRTNGCDSTIRMVLSEIPSYAFFDTAFVCQGDTLDFEGQVIFNPGKYVANLQTEAGCDSILNLRVYRKENVFFEKFSNLCFGDTLIFGEQEITGAGVYTETFESFSGCDSTVRLTITQFVLDTGLTINGNTLVSKESNATYQWINCETGQAISGATTMSFNTNQPGTYAVVISRDGCSDSSRCVELNKTSIFEIQSRSTPISVFPNPAKNLLSVDLNSVNQNYTYSITDLQGRIIQTGQLSKGSNVIKIEDLGQGSYFLRLEDGEKKFFARFIKY